MNLYTTLTIRLVSCFTKIITDKGVSSDFQQTIFGNFRVVTKSTKIHMFEQKFSLPTFTRK